jgi:hypothetical protein
VNHESQRRFEQRTIAPTGSNGASGPRYQICRHHLHFSSTAVASGTTLVMA